MLLPVSSLSHRLMVKIEQARTTVLGASYLHAGNDSGDFVRSLPLVLGKAGPEMQASERRAVLRAAPRPKVVGRG
jgi:hypothetical protein